MRLGIFAKTFPRATLEETLDAVVAHGLYATQFNLSVIGLPTLPPDAVPSDLAAHIRTAAATRGIELCALSGTYNVAHPDSRARSEGLRRICGLVAVAPVLGIRLVTLCTGTRDPDDMWRHHADNRSPAAWADMRDSIAGALAAAEAHDVVLAIEPERNNVVHNAAAARRLLDELATPHLKAIVDPANLVDPHALSRQRQTISAAVELLGEHLVLAHAKDVRSDGELVAAGRGQLDYDTYLDALREAGYEGPLVLHGLGEHEVPASVAFLRARLVAARQPI